MDLAIVLTTVQEPTDSVRAFERVLLESDATMIVAGDRKGPASFEVSGAVFLGLEDQLGSGFQLARLLPTGHYCRKNIAYLEAMRRGAACIYETDDDNAPLPSWAPRKEEVAGARAVEAARAGRWVNAYRYFSDDVIWPRGFPLDEIRSSVPQTVRADVARTPIQQGLVNGSPDVDAIWRLAMDRPFEFRDEASVSLEPGNWCPFNTQSTWWWPVAYPLLYVPSHCSFRMCDIWKSFVAQRCLWELGLGIAFHSAEVFQARNVHDLMRDFRDELPGYERNRELGALLASLTLDSGEAAVSSNLMRCYEALVGDGFFPEEELILVASWVEAVS